MELQYGMEEQVIRERPPRQEVGIFKKGYGSVKPGIAPRFVFLSLPSGQG